MTARALGGRVAGLLFALAIAGCAGGRATDTDPRLLAGDLTQATQRFLSHLSDEQRALAQRDLADDEAMLWHFVPGRYAGVPLGQLDEQQKAAANGVLRAMLSDAGFVKTMAIVELENVLRALESTGGRDASHRDPDRYALLVCGEPAVGGTFVVRFQGHHVSLRTAVVDGLLAGFAPHFLGSNPHRLPEPSRQRPVLHQEEQLARDLLALFDQDQLQRVIIGATAPPDVLLGPGKAPSELGERRGLPWSEMNAEQRDQLWLLIRDYAHRHRAEVAVLELERIRNEHLDELSFAWAGSTEPGEGHYYRVHGNHFAIEYDCTQNDANHVHTVWRDFERDFGGDALRAHLEQQHGQ